MRIPDPMGIKMRSQVQPILYAWAQRQGTHEHQEDAFGHFEDECFVMADGVGGMPHGDIASSLAVDTALWGYKHIRLRRFYWAGKTLFIKRIFRTTNLTVWQKHRETGFENGMATTMTVVLCGAKTLWIGNVGDSRAYIFRKNRMTFTTTDDVDEHRFLTKVIGMDRFGLVPHVYTESFIAGDVLMLATDGITQYVSAEILAGMLGDEATTGDLEKKALEIVSIAENQGSADDKSVCLVKHMGK